MSQTPEEVINQFSDGTITYGEALAWFMEAFSCSQEQAKDMINDLVNRSHIVRISG